MVAAGGGENLEVRPKLRKPRVCVLVRTRAQGANMRFAKRLLMVAGAVAIAGVLSVALVPRAVRAVVATVVQIVPGSSTHLGQNESQLVNLLCTEYTNGCVLVGASGVAASSPYVVPAGNTLVITDYEWYAARQSSGYLACDTIFIQAGGSVYGNFGIALPNYSCTNPLPSGQAYRAEHFTSGVRIPSGGTVVDYYAYGQAGSAGVQGYLVPN
jgi:hypothetical protein